ncbi:NAD(P)-binding protein [Tenacibaculum sp. MEBiC06402]|uniref:NAD(P)-binding protein n=1 Tax=unclassified Tenacibaculum TaxID=2635139 RepID=UPI003B9A730A
MQKKEITFKTQFIKMNTTKNFDIIIIGAGVSGIGMACRLEKEIENLNYAILERRSEIGGTWDLFNYPGIRSDSDMLTFGYDFRPWNGDKTLADGPSIKQYLIDTAEEYKVKNKIFFNSKVTFANWDSEEGRWNITVQDEETQEQVFYTCNFLIAASGYTIMMRVIYQSSKGQNYSKVQ